MSVTRQQVETTLDEARTELKKHGGNVELVGVSDQGVVMVRLTGACAGCKSAPITLRDIIEKTLKEKLPEVQRVDAIL